MRALSAIALGACLSGCGGLENQPLTLGVVRGALERSAAGGWVSIAGQPETRRALGPQGTFEFVDLPRGSLDLLLVPNDTEALRRSVTVQPAEVSDLGRLAAHPGGFVKVHVVSTSGLAVGNGTVRVNGEPWSTPLDVDGHGIVGPLPAGCWDVHVEVPGAALLERESCVVEGEKEEVEYELPDPDGTPGHEGCAVTGCQEGLECHDDGKCR